MNGPDSRPQRLAADAGVGSAQGTRDVRMISPKIGDRHRDKLALVYIRQSSPQQVLEHRESLARQYALQEHAASLGWPAERIWVIDEDLGRSGTSSAQRSGFQRLLAEVGMGHVGLVLALEASRLCRSNKDWAHLTEVCAVVDCLLADQDGIYDANDFNDHLLLGLKGTMSELELALMRNRLERGRQNKAARGELFQKVPVGYVKLPNGQAALDPDEQVRSVVHLIFAKYEELGSVYAVFRYLLRQHIRLGIRCHEGPQRGDLQWRRPCVITLYHMLHHPMYAGAYVFGRYRRQRKASAQGSLTTEVKTLPQAQWKVLLRDRVPAYITWEQYLANQERLRQHRSGPGCRGAARTGAALLPGLLVCGHCGGRLHIQYEDGHKSGYVCCRHYRDPSQPRCPSVSAPRIDAFVSEQVLRALEPAALELSRQAFDDLERDRARLERHWQQRLDRARYEADRAHRQYQAVEPENRLVARTLEQAWEEALRQQRHVQEDYDRFLAQQPPRLTEVQRQRIDALAADIPALWCDPATTAQDKKEIIRCLIERVVVTRAHGSAEVTAAIHWHGGQVSQHRFQTPTRFYANLPNYQQLLDRVVHWRQRGCTTAQIAAKLNEEGFQPPKRRNDFTAEMVAGLLHRRGLGAERLQTDLLRPHEWWTADLARELGISPQRVHKWIQRGWVSARRTPIHHRWLVWADPRELRRLRRLLAASAAAPSHRPGPDFKTPRKPPKT